MVRSGRRWRSRQAVSLALVLGLVSGCSPETTPEPSVDTGGQPDAVVLDDLSENFTLTVHPTTLYLEGSTVYISYRAEVVNKSQETFPGFYASVVLDRELDQYLAAGVTPLPFTKLNLFPQGETNLDDPMGAAGVEIVFDQIVSDRQFLAEAGLDVDRLFELGEQVTLWLRWDGGEERLEYTTPLEDPDHLLSS